MTKIILVSKDGARIESTVEAMQCSYLIRSITENYEEEDENFGEIPLPNIKNDTELKKIVEFCEYQTFGPGKKLDTKEPVPYPLRSSDIVDTGIPLWYINFVDIDVNFLFKILKDSRYMMIDILAELCCAKLVTTFKGKRPEEIREKFGIVD